MSSINNLENIIEGIRNRISDFNYMINSEPKDNHRVYAWKYARAELDVILKRLIQFDNKK